MTPQGWLIEDLAAAGFIWLFAGALLGAGIGVAVGLVRGALPGLGSGLLVWGLGNLVVSAGVLAYVHADTVVLPLQPLRCEATADTSGEPRHRIVLRVQRPGEPAHELRLPAAQGSCPEDLGATVALRLRRDALASAALVVQGDVVDERPAAFALIWGLFGAFGLLAGAALIANARRNTARAPAQASAVAPAAPWRTRIGERLALLGLAVFVSAFVGGLFLDGSTERAVQFGLRAAGTAFLIWLCSGLIAGTMSKVPAAVMVLLAGVLLSLAELMRRL